MENDYEKWIYYLGQSDKWTEELEIRTAFDTFLAAFAWDNRQWTNYAKSIFRVTGSVEQATVIFTEATERLPYNAMLWCDFLTFIVDSRACVDIEKFLDNAVFSLCGHPDAGEFWKLAICILRSNGSILILLKYFYLVLSCPCPYSKDVFHSFKCIQDTMTIAEESIEARGFAPVVGADLVRARHLLDNMTEQYENSLVEWELRQPYEEKVTRRVYCLSALSLEEIEAWHEYLTFEQRRKKEHHSTEAGEGRIVTGTGYPKESELVEHDVVVIASKLQMKSVEMLFERCLVPCATYPEMWRRYCLYLMSHNAGGLPAALTVAYRGLSTFLQQSVDMFLFYASLLEADGAEAEAREVYGTLLTPKQDGSRCSSSLEVVFRAADFERRVRGDKEGLDIVLSLYDSALRDCNCRQFANAVICKKAQCISNFSRYGGVGAGLRVALSRGQEKPLSDRPAYSMLGELSDVDDSLLQSALQYDVDLSVVKCIFDLLLRFPSSSQRDEKVWTLLASALATAACAHPADVAVSMITRTNDEIGDLEDGEVNVKSSRPCYGDSQRRRGPPAGQGALLDLKGASCPALVQLLKHYCEDHSCNVTLKLRAEALVDTCSSAYRSQLGCNRHF